MNKIIESTKNDIIRDVRRCMSILVVDEPFTMPIVKFKILLCGNTNIAKTDGFSIYINPVKWMNLSSREKIAVLFHEWLHIALFHTKRVGSRHFRTWNYSCDYAINYIILIESKSKKFTLPKRCLLDEAYYDMSAEQIYDDLIKRKENSNDGFGNKNGKGSEQDKDKFIQRDEAAQMLNNEEIFDEMLDDLLPAPSNVSDQDLKQEILQAAIAHNKLKGTLPAYYKRIIDSIKNAQVPWSKLFHSLVKQVLFFGNERSFAHPKPYGWLYGIALPGPTGHKKPKVVVIYDTSASISDKELSKFNAEFIKVMEHCDQVTVITADCKVHEVVRVRKVSDVISTAKGAQTSATLIKFTGGGGTDFRPALQRAAKERSDLVIYFTDGHGTYGGRIPGLNRVLWVLNNNKCKAPPFGKYITIN